jgi:hypothetical protein
MSSATQPRLLDEAELNIVSGGLSFNLLGAQYTLNGNQLTETIGTTTTTRTLTPTQSADLQAVRNAVQAGVVSSLAAANMVLSDLRVLFA